MEDAFVDFGGGGDNSRFQNGAEAESLNPDISHRRGDGDVLKGALGEGTIPDLRH